VGRGALLIVRSEFAGPPTPNFFGAPAVTPGLVPTGALPMLMGLVGVNMDGFDGRPTKPEDFGLPLGDPPALLGWDGNNGCDEMPIGCEGRVGSSGAPNDPRVGLAEMAGLLGEELNGDSLPPLPCCKTLAWVDTSCSLKDPLGVFVELLLSRSDLGVPEGVPEGEASAEYVGRVVWGCD
jgi:hypothetical protein